MTLVLIGDPKQAIYAFRGADVYAYLAAAQSGGARRDARRQPPQRPAAARRLRRAVRRRPARPPRIVYRHVAAAPANRRPAAARRPGAGRCGCASSTARPSIERTASGFPQRRVGARLRRPRRRGRRRRAARLAARTIERRDERARRVGSARSRPGDIAVLVRTRWNAALVQGELEAAGVPAVISGAGSVFATEAAADWQGLLQALEQPSPARARAAALTPLLGWDATQLATAGEDELEALHQRLHAGRGCCATAASRRWPSDPGRRARAGTAALPARRRAPADGPRARRRAAARGGRRRAARGRGARRLAARADRRPPSARARPTSARGGWTPTPPPCRC